jgi:cytochrome c-type biogenesis protein CcmF
LPWRKANRASLRRALLLPVAAALVTVAALALLGVHKPYALLGFGLCSLVTTGILVEWWRGAVSRHRTSGENLLLAWLRLIAANRPRYGGYIVHLSVVMVALGVLGGSFFETQRDVVLSPGETFDIANYQIRYIGTATEQKSDRTEFTATVEVYRDGSYLDTLMARRSFYPDFNMASTLAAIRSTPVEDFYVVPSENLDNGAVGFRILVNPLVWWLWVAGPVLVLGTVVALWPQRAPVTVRAPQANRLPAGSRPSAA